MSSTNEKMAIGQELSHDSKDSHSKSTDMEDTAVGQVYASPSASEEKSLLRKIDLR
jgi:hypothetical protein